MFDEKKLVLMPQEQEGSYKFDSKPYMTSGFLEEFGDNAALIVAYGLQRIRHTYWDNCDYFQVMKYKGKKFYVIDDSDHLTFLLPSEY